MISTRWTTDCVKFPEALEFNHCAGSCFRKRSRYIARSEGEEMRGQGEQRRLKQKPRDQNSRRDEASAMTKLRLRTQHTHKHPHPHTTLHTHTQRTHALNSIAQSMIFGSSIFWFGSWLPGGPRKSPKPRKMALRGLPGAPGALGARATKIYKPILLLGPLKRPSTSPRANGRFAGSLRGLLSAWSTVSIVSDRCRADPQKVVKSHTRGHRKVIEIRCHGRRQAMM
jgi:hypothetical protein